MTHRWDPVRVTADLGIMATKERPNTSQNSNTGLSQLIQFDIMPWTPRVGVKLIPLMLYVHTRMNKIFVFVFFWGGRRFFLSF